MFRITFLNMLSPSFHPLSPAPALFPPLCAGPTYQIKQLHLWVNWAPSKRNSCIISEYLVSLIGVWGGRGMEEEGRCHVTGGD